MSKSPAYRLGYETARYERQPGPRIAHVVMNHPAIMAERYGLSDERLPERFSAPEASDFWLGWLAQFHPNVEAR